MTHPHVQHPNEVIKERKQQRRQKHPVLYANDRFLEWMTNHVLASVVVFDIALIVPLIVLLPWLSKLQIVLIILSSNWFQFWALPALQRSQNHIQKRQEAKASTDHKTLTYLAEVQDEQIEILRRLDALHANDSAED